MTKKKMSFSAKSFLGMGIGIVVGLLAGDYAAILQPLGAIFLQILQMTVIPFLVVSLMLGITSMDPGMLRKVGVAMGLAFLVVWTLGVASSFTLGAAFPRDGTPTFHVHPAAGIDGSQSSMVDLFITRNPFASLADGAVPAVVLFFILLSIHLVRHPRKSAVLDLLQPVQDALLWLTSWLMRVVPYGVFVLTAELSGTISVADFQKLALYIGLYLAGAVVLAFWLLPMALSLSTPYPFRTLLRDNWGSVALAIGAGSTFVALPMIVKNLTETIASSAEPQCISEMEAVVPIAYNIPSAGTMLSFLFLLFASSAYGIDMSVWEEVQMVATGIPTLFGGGTFAVGFMLDQAGIPNDAMSLYTSAGSLVSRFNSGATAASLIAVSFWIHSALSGTLRPRPLPLALLVGGTLGGLLVAASAIRPLVSHGDTGIDHFAMQPAKSTVVEMLDAVPQQPVQGSARERLMRGEPLVAGYFPDTLPYSYRNFAGESVGYYLDMADRLGRDLGIAVQLAPLKRGEADEALLTGRVDTIFAPVALTKTSLKRFDFSRIYATERSFLLLPPGHSEDIEDRIGAKDLSGLRLAVLRGSSSAETASEIMPGASFTPVYSIAEFESGGFDGLLLDEVLAQVTQIRNPLFHALPIATDPIVHFALPVRPGSDLRIVLDVWLQMVEQEGFLEALDVQWIDGKFEVQEQKRRSLLLEMLTTRSRSDVDSGS